MSPDAMRSQVVSGAAGVDAVAVDIAMAAWQSHAQRTHPQHTGPRA
ncbi:hypothetical protein AZ78_5186 [Lysobacter capsici AZ78]|jgi:hypothetical protein|uniref:Uncharacterized protein n=1 Tax=Lysobacter capsici AZ78 TaxID=1444315 RepID=A0A125TZG9_9GAMM|nr:hypothetical protein [Lysobacter capsici]KWS02053.1 hypothetical protein AZ78_5186 [Lysobacter capsici AZ78]WND78896.1 hypothetical protein RJ610_16505 [Lysobacter capsici]WND84091.1 hypothetical protein RJ609_16515 [Lysobacter capsici]